MHVNQTVSRVWKISGPLIRNSTSRAGYLKTRKKNDKNYSRGLSGN